MRKVMKKLRSIEEQAKLIEEQAETIKIEEVISEKQSTSFPH